MATGATIGAATVVTSNGNKASGKYQSYMAEKMRATAEANRRNPEIAAAMVDEKIQVDSLQNGKVLTLTSQRALSKGYCEAIVDNEQQILARLQLKPSQVVYYTPGWLELIIRFFMHPIVSSLLLLMIMAGLFLELKAPGAGFPIVLAVTSAVLYFAPYYLYGLAQHWELVLLFLGIVMLLVELFVIPGFGLLGIAGLIVTLGALVLVMLDNKWFDFSEVNTMDIFNAVFVVGVAITGAVVLLIIGLPLVFKSKRFKAISLQKSMNRELGYNSGTLNKRLVGQEGITYTVLRPSGKIMVENELYDATTRGDYIEKGEKVIIIQQNGPTAIVKKATEE
ncbi:MAG TPA: serine protease [Microscillaceae bacterium]|nr:serine protease [Microscillaceae bacterium]